MCTHSKGLPYRSPPSSGRYFGRFLSSVAGEPQGNADAGRRPTCPEAPSSQSDSSGVLSPGYMSVLASSR
ncbi:hypothetical protein EDC02_2540 [Micromonospora sp. Llam0]|nr:hypothetical protein EDC02_2540 [Micromonospora sp. Llam0]